MFHCAKRNLQDNSVIARVVRVVAWTMLVFNMLIFYLERDIYFHISSFISFVDWLHSVVVPKGTKTPRGA